MVALDIEPVAGAQQSQERHTTVTVNSNSATCGTTRTGSRRPRQAASSTPHDRARRTTEPVLCVSVTWVCGQFVAYVLLCGLSHRVSIEYCFVSMTPSVSPSVWAVPVYG
eukprot:scaffold5935_cov137-Isochrysis_galbana.AAC.6